MGESYKIPSLTLIALLLQTNNVFALLTPLRRVAFCPIVVNPFFSKNAAKTQLEMCICIDCARVTNCKAYHFVETKHCQPHMTENPTFEPQEGSPTIHVNIRTVRGDEERGKEMQRMWNEHTEETKRAEAAAGGAMASGPLHGEKKYDLSPVTTYEYDVVRCDDYVHEPGAWVKNMPEEIKECNPHFVPS